jgi:acyl carrier protein
MSQRKIVLGVILRAVENLSDELEDGAKISVDEDTKLFGTDAVLDSLSLVSVIVDVETAISEKFNTPIALTDDRAMSREVSPFANVTALADYIVELLAEAGL